MKISSTGNGSARAREFVPNGGNVHGDVFERTFDPAVDRPSHVVVDAVRFIRNVDATELDPLHDAIDPEALDRVLEDRGRTRDAALEVTFTYDAFEIHVNSDGRLWLRWDDAPE